MEAPLFSELLTIYQEWSKNKEVKVSDGFEYEKQSSYLYVLSCPEFIDSYGYKIGFHTGSQKDLKKRYITALPNHIIYAFFPATKDIEDIIKEKFIEYRVLNNNHNNSEYYRLPLPDIFSIISKITKPTHVTPKRIPSIKTLISIEEL